MDSEFGSLYAKSSQWSFLNNAVCFVQILSRRAGGGLFVTFKNSCNCKKENRLVQKPSLAWNLL